jgi:hypothetical protein
MWWIAGATAGAAAVLVIVANLRAQLVRPAIGFLIGYAPAIIGRIGNHDLGAPLSRLDAAGLRTALPDITHLMLPILFGWRDPAGHPTTYPALAFVLMLVVVISYWNIVQLRKLPVFHVFLFVAAAMFLISGSYIDAQSYRYLMPIYAALPVIYAVGVDAAWRASRIAGAALLASVLLIFTAQQIAWFNLLQPDRHTEQTIACLEAAGVTAARAPYWQSYTVTFVTRERIIVSPIDGIDRYPPYSERTRSAPMLDQIGCR